MRSAATWKCVPPIINQYVPAGLTRYFWANEDGIKLSANLPDNIYKVCYNKITSGQSEFDFDEGVLSFFALNKNLSRIVNHPVRSF